MEYFLPFINIARNKNTFLSYYITVAVPINYKKRRGSIMAGTDCKKRPRDDDFWVWIILIIIIILLLVPGVFVLDKQEPTI